MSDNTFNNTNFTQKSLCFNPNFQSDNINNSYSSNNQNNPNNQNKINDVETRLAQMYIRESNPSNPSNPSNESIEEKPIIQQNNTDNIKSNNNICQEMFNEYKIKKELDKREMYKDILNEIKNTLPNNFRNNNNCQPLFSQSQCMTDTTISANTLYFIIISFCLLLIFFVMIITLFLFTSTGFNKKPCLPKIRMNVV